MRLMTGCLAALALGLGLAGGPARADQDRAGDFAFYVLALSWNSAWCAREGDRRGADSCDIGSGKGFTLRGLWPQHEQGWPEDCTDGAGRDPSRRDSDAMADIWGSGGLAWYEWKKHGRCSGLDGRAYYALVRKAWESVSRPAVLRRITETMRVPPGVIEAAFVEANVDLDADEIGLTCGRGQLAEARICLSRDDLSPVPCSVEVDQACRASAVTILPVR